MLRPLLIGCILTTISACTNLGPKLIESQKNSYTEIIALSEKQELLSNIVRAKYNVPPVFLQVQTITVAPSLRVQSGTNLSYNSNDSGLVSSLGPSIEYKEEPRIIFTPLSGAEFASELLVPTGLVPVYLMLVNGFRFDKVANLALVSINDISNLRSAPEQERNKFKRVIETIQRLIEEDIVYVTVSEKSINEGLSELTVKVNENNWPHHELIELTKIMNLDMQSFDEISIKMGKRAGINHINVQTRSLLAIINYLSNFVEVPKFDEQKVWPVDFFDEKNRPITIKYSESKPNNAYVSINYKGRWFYIDETDVDSQNSLYLLRILFDLQSERDAKNNNLLLTLPVQ